MKTHALRRAALALAALAALASSCASQSAYRRARRALDGGDLEAAVFSAVEALERKSRNYEALALLESAFPEAVASLKARSELALGGEDPARWETAAASWSSIHAMNAAVASLPPLYRKGSAEPVAFTFEYDHELLALAREEAAGRRYAEGLSLLASGSRAKSREAFASFSKALELVPGYRDAAALAAKARELGSDRIAVLPFSAPSGDFGARSCASQLYGDAVTALVALAQREDFLQVVDRGSIESMLAERELTDSDLGDPRTRLDPASLYGANILVQAQVVAYRPEYPSVKLRTENFSIMVSQPVPGALPVNGVVPTMRIERKASVTVFLKTSAVSISVAYRAVDIETSVILDARTFSRSIRDEHEWAVYQGDREALPPDYAALVDRREAGVKPPESLLPDLCDLVAKDLAASFAAAR